MGLPAENLQFKGLLPGIDRKRIAEPFVVEGTNFIVDVDGPVSLFGKTLLMHEDILEPRGFQTFRDETTVGTLYFTSDAICKYDIITRQLYPIYRHTARTTFWPWSVALVGTSLYFANQELFGAGYLAYAYITGIWQIITDEASMFEYLPQNVYAVTESFGRLIILSGDRVNVSEIEDGTALMPSTSTGAGFQKLSIICAADLGLTVLAYDKGFLVYTCSGILQGEYTNATNPFRYDVLSINHVIVNAWAVINAGGENESQQHIMVTKRGLSSTLGHDEPTAWGGLMGEHFHRNILPFIKTERDDMTIRLANDFDSAIIYISVAEDSRLAIYSKAFAFYVPSEQWGVYSSTHTALTEIIIDTGAFLGRHFGVCDINGNVYRFSATDSDRLYPIAAGTIVEYKLHTDIPIQYAGAKDIAGMEDVLSIASTMMLIGSDAIHDATDMADIFNTYHKISRSESPTTVITIAATDEDPDESVSPQIWRTVIAAQTAIFQFTFASEPLFESNLNASITIGLFRYPQEDNIQFITQLQKIIVGMLNSGVADSFIDWIADFMGEELETDWNTDITGDEDWGKASGNNTSYSIEAIGSLDGYATWIPVIGTEMKITPTEILSDGRVKHFAGVVSGAYLLIRFFTAIAGDIFHVKHLKLETSNAGRLL